MRHLKYTLRDWAVRHAQGPRAKQWLGFFSFAEATFFPIPPDIILVSILAAQEQKEWKRCAAIAAGWSVVGGVFGYVIGLFLYDSIGVFLVELYNLEMHVAEIRDVFAQNAFIAMFLAGFTLIPYKAFTISAGFFEISFLVFVVASVLSRAARFFVVAYLMYRFGDEIGRFALRYFNTITVVLAVAVILALVFLYI